MELKEALKKLDEKIKTFFSKIKFIAVVAIDGTQLKWEGELTAGTPVFIVTEEADVPAPAGEYQLEDGSVLVVDENGLAVELKPATETPAEKISDDIEMSQEGIDNFFEWLFKFRKSVSAYPAVFASLRKENELLKSEIEQLKTDFIAFRAAPAGDAIEKPSFIRAKIGTDRINQIKKALKEITN